jgi:hypothetical protein
VVAGVKRNPERKMAFNSVRGRFIIEPGSFKTLGGKKP